MRRCRESFSKSLKRKGVVGSGRKTVLSGCVALANHEVTLYHAACMPLPRCCLALED